MSKVSCNDQQTEKMAMNKRFWMSVFLVCAVSVTMTGCKGLFKKKGSGSDSEIAGIGAGGAGSELGADMPTRIGEGGTIVDAQLAAVQFAFDSATVDDSERAKAEAAAEYLKSNAGTVVTLEGHCDERGSAEYNMSLGERRALSVRSYLMSLGIDGARIQTKSFGFERPKDPGHDENAWAINRRVEFVVMKP
jgi:peptidoglycan-associated lipoprotein